MNYRTGSMLGHLEELTKEAWRIKEKVEAEGDLRTALACIAALYRMIELAARLRGELDDRSHTNVVNVNISSETAKRIEETYVARHKTQELESK